jgi:hypothetical protein
MRIPLVHGRVWLPLALILGLLAAGCGSDTTGPSASLAGTWDVLGFTDMGVAATTTGTADFRADGTFVVSGTIAFPGEPAESLVINGSYDQNGSTVVLTTDSETSNWTIAVSGNNVTLTEVEPPPANTIMLRRTS